MKKHILRTLLLLTTASLAFACYKDNGNYDYDWVPGLSIDLGASSTAVSAGKDFRLEPVIRTVEVTGYQQHDTLDVFRDPVNYSFQWNVYDSDKEVVADWGTEQTLETTVDIPISSSAYTLVLSVTENNSGAVWTKSLELNVTGDFFKGLALLYEDEDGKADVDIYGTTPDMDHYYMRNVLSSSGFPYSGSPTFITFEPSSRTYPSRLWIGTDQETCWLTTPTFEWMDNYMASIIRSERKEEGYYYTACTPVSSVLFFASADSEIAYKNYTNILQARNLLLPGLYPSDKPDPADGNKYERVDFAPYVGGWISQYIWDKTNRRMLRLGLSLASGVSGVDAISTIDDANSFYGMDYELVYMRTVNYSNFYCIFKNSRGNYLNVHYGINTGTLSFDVQSITEYPASASTYFDSAEIIEFSNDDNAGTYIYSGGMLYAVMSTGVVETDIILNAGDRITKIKVLLTDGSANTEYANTFMVAVYNESSQTGRIDLYNTDYAYPEQLELTGTIEDTPRVVDIFNFY